MGWNWSSRWLPARRVLLLAAAAAAMGPLGCAKAPSTSGSGTRLVVSMTFNGPVSPNYQYFALIRSAADSSGVNGPIPVVEPPYMNGFATGSNTETAAFTDFVEYSQVQEVLTTSGYALYHVIGGIEGDPNLKQFQARGEVDRYVVPSGGNSLQFEIDLSRLAPSSGETDANNGATPRYLQFNIVATTTTPTNPQSVDPAKVVDAIGDQRLGSGSFNTFITIDTAQTGRIYKNSTSSADSTYEPEGDSYPSDKDPAVDLIAWSVQVVTR